MKRLIRRVTGSYHALAGGLALASAALLCGAAHADTGAAHADAGAASHSPAALHAAESWDARVEATIEERLLRGIAQGPDVSGNWVLVGCWQVQPDGVAVGAPEGRSYYSSVFAAPPQTATPPEESPYPLLASH